MALTQEELAMFDAPAADAAEPDPFAELPPPAAAPIPDSTKPPMFAECEHCSAALTKENGSRLPSGKWIHIGCPKGPAQVKPPDAPADSKDVAPPAKAAKKPKAAKTEAPAPSPGVADVVALQAAITGAVAPGVGIGPARLARALRAMADDLERP